MGAENSRLHTGNASLTLHLEFIQHLLVRPTCLGGDCIRHLRAWVRDDVVRKEGKITSSSLEDCIR